MLHKRQTNEKKPTLNNEFGAFRNFDAIHLIDDSLVLGFAELREQHVRSKQRTNSWGKSRPVVTIGGIQAPDNKGRTMMYRCAIEQEETQAQVKSRVPYDAFVESFGKLQCVPTK